MLRLHPSTCRPLAGLALVLLGPALLVLCIPERQAPAADRSAAYLFLSPNTDEHLDLTQAQQRLRSPDHARYRRLASHILGDLGVAAHQVHDVLGDWGGGAENSLLVVLPCGTDPEAVRYAAASFGLAARQKSVLAFHADPSGPDALVTLDLPGLRLEEVRKALDEHGLPERTLLAHAGGWRALVVLAGGACVALPGVPGAAATRQPGRGEYLGEPDRLRAGERYRAVIRAYQAQRHRLPLARLGR
jgi:hypothetical protein